MNEEEVELLFNTFYEEEPKIGSTVILRHKFTDTSCSGEIRGLKRTAPQRGGHTDLDFQFIVYVGLKIKIAGIDGWLDTDRWTIVDQLEGINYKKLPIRDED